MVVPPSWVVVPSPQVRDAVCFEGGVLESGVLKSGVLESGVLESGAARLAHPAGEVLLGPFAAAAWLRALIAIGLLQGRGGRPDQPGVDRAPLSGRGLLDRDLELLGQAYVDPRGGAVLGEQQAAVRRAVCRGRSVLRREPERPGGWRGHDE